MHENDLTNERKRYFRRATFEHYANISHALFLNPGRLDSNSAILHNGFSSRIKTPLERYMNFKTCIAFKLMKTKEITRDFYDTCFIKYFCSEKTTSVQMMRGS